MVRSPSKDELVPMMPICSWFEAYHVLIYRPIMGDKFEDNPTVSTKITVKHKATVVDQTEVEQGYVAWYPVLPVHAPDSPSPQRIQNTSTEAGYQSAPWPLIYWCLGYTLSAWSPQKEKHFGRNPISSSKYVFLLIPLSFASYVRRLQWTRIETIAGRMINSLGISGDVFPSTWTNLSTEMWNSFGPRTQKVRNYLHLVMFGNIRLLKAVVSPVDEDRLIQSAEFTYAGGTRSSSRTWNPTRGNIIHNGPNR